MQPSTPTRTPTVPPPGSPGAPDLVTHLLRDHGLSFVSDPPVCPTGAGGLYDLTAMQAHHREQHGRRETDHEHDWGQRGR
jgi:hypothetical protein